MESRIKVGSLPMIHIQSESLSPVQISTVLTQELQILMNEVEKLREETKSIICNCSHPCCPFSTTAVTSEEEVQPIAEDHEFEQGRSPDFGFGSMESIYQKKSNRKNRLSLPNVAQIQLTSSYHHHHQLHHNCTSLTSIPRGVQKRADGTILEKDYPGFYCSIRKSKKKTRWMGSFSVTHLNRLGVCSVEVPQLLDCQVDQDGVIPTNEDYKFSRAAPERRNMRSPHGSNNRFKLKLTSSNPIAYRRASADPLSFDKLSLNELTRHSSVPSIVSVTKRMHTK